ncbi:MAG: helix-turn-helix domain-containing protein [Phenylobacterium sp.]|nr:helix-turn-helix domain-containing protein [Phenylobacterium sp.]
MVELAAIVDTLHEANRQSGRDHYRLVLLSEGAEPLRSSAGPRILVDASLAEFTEPIDTLIVLPAARGHALPGTADTIDWLRRTAPKTRRYGSTCTGVFILGAAGLLGGRRVTTHWQFADELVARHPEAIVEPDRIFIRDGDMFSSAGVTAAFDLMLALVEEDLGREIALAVAQFFVLFLKRPGGQSQFSAQLAAQFSANEPIQDSMRRVNENLRGDLSVGRLARDAGMSERSFARAFSREARMTPAAYVELARVDAARRLLEEQKLPLQRIAVASGFSTMQAMRRALFRQLGATPREYRERFGSAFATEDVDV